MLVMRFVAMQAHQLPPTFSLLFACRDMIRMTRGCLFSLIVVLATSHASFAQPAISYSTPRGIAPGKTTTVTLYGGKLSGPIKVWTSFAAKVAVTPSKNAAAVTCKITVPANTPVGIGGIVVATAAGASDPLMMMIDDLPSVADNGKNHSPEAAQMIAFPSAIDGLANGTRSDHYKFKGKKGQRVSVEVVSVRLGTTFDGVLFLKDSKGRELAYSDDDPAIGSDCRVSAILPADGDYIVSLHDNKFGSGQRYRLRVGDFPLVNSAYPLGARAGSIAKLSFAGPAADKAGPLIVAVPRNVPGNRLPISVRNPGGKSSAMTTLAVGHIPEAKEKEPNGIAKQATAVTLPCSVNGVFSERQDIDFYEFAGAKGQRFVFRSLTKSLGSPAYAMMKIYDASGKKLAETGISGATEYSLTYAIPADGMYRLSVEEMLQRSGRDFSYRIEIRSDPRFTLTLKQTKTTKNRFSLHQANGAMFLDLTVGRTGYTGPIELSADAPGFTFLNGTIPAKATAHRLIVTTPAGFKPGDFRAMRVIGKAVDSDAVAVMSTAPYIKAKMPNMMQIPAWYDGLVTVGTVGAQKPFYTASLDKKSLFMPNHVGTTTFKLNMTSLDKKNFKTGVSLYFQGLPTGLTSSVKANKAKTQYTVTIGGGKNFTPGRYPISVVAYGDLKGRGMTTSFSLPLEINSAISVRVAPIGPIVAGKKQKVRIYADRHGKDNQAVQLKWLKLPAGVTAPAVTIPANKDMVEVELTAAKNAKVGKFSGLSVQAVTKFGGKPITVQSAPADLQVAKAS